MKIALFVPCYINAVYPEVATASYKLLRSLGLDVEYPEDQTCCGQPMANAGFQDEALQLARRLDRMFEHYDYIVGPSASCVVFVRDHYEELLGDESRGSSARIYEICEFLHDVVKPARLPAKFPHKVSLQNSCHGVRLLHLSSNTEQTLPYYNKLRNLLSLVEGIEIVEPERPDECCGFGGMFSAEETAVSGRMGRDKLQRHLATGAEYIVGADSSCLMHQRGLIERDRLPIRTLHAVEILAAGL